jgi:hypothetical protein
MPETTEAPPIATTPVIPEGASMETLFNAITGQEPTVPGTPSVQPQVKTEPKVEPKVEPAKPAAADDIPAQFLEGKTEPKPEAGDDFDTLVTQEPQGQTKHEHYKRLQVASKAKVDKVTAELTAARQELEAAKSRGVPEEIQAELKNYKEALAEREAVLERIAVQESPKFKERYTQAETAIAERLKRYGTEMAMDTEKLDQALRSSPKRRIELLDEMGVEGAALSSVAGLMNQYDLLQDDKTQFLSKSKEAHAQWQKEQAEAAASQEKEQTEREERVFSTVAEEMGKTYAPFQEVEGNEAWNAQVRALRDEAKKYFNGQVPLDQLARAVMKGVGAPVQEKIIARQQATIKELTAELAGLKTAQPRANGSVDSPNGKVDMSNMSSEQRMIETWRQAMGGA